MNSVTVLYPLGNIGHPTTGGQVYDYKLFEIIKEQGVGIQYIDNAALGHSKGESVYKLPLRLLSNLRKLAKHKSLIYNTALFPYYIIPFFFLKIFYPQLKIYGIHHHFRYQEQSGWKRKIYKSLEFINLKQCNQVINPCPYTRDVLLQGWKDGKVITLENAFDNTTKPTSSYESFKFLYVGSVYERKGIIYLLNAISKLPEDSKKNLEINIVGQMDEKSEYSKCLISFVKKNNLENIVYFRGRVTDDQLQEYYKHAYAFILPSLLEGYGLVIIEAMSYGLPVIAFNNSAMPYTISNGENGLLVKNKDIDDLKNKINLLINNKELHTHLAIGAKKTALHAHSLSDLKIEISKFCKKELF